MVVHWDVVARSRQCLSVMPTACAYCVQSLRVLARAGYRDFQAQSAADFLFQHHVYMIHLLMVSPQNQNVSCRQWEPCRLQNPQCLALGSMYCECSK